MTNEAVTELLNLLVGVLRPADVKPETLALWFDPAERAAKALAEVSDEACRTFIALGQNSWGRASTQDAAIVNMVKAGGSRRMYLLYSCPPGTSVNGMGGLTYPNAARMLGMPEPFEVARKGIPLQKNQEDSDGHSN